MAQENLSLIPYATDSREIILRHGAAVVLYDEQSKQVSLRLSADADEVEVAECPYCRRPYPTTSSASAQESPVGSESDPAFVNPSYFRLLQNSRHGSQQSSRAASPRLRLVEPEAESPRPRHSQGETTDPLAASQKISSHAIQQKYFKTFFVEEGELGRGGKGVVLLVRHVIDGVDLGRFACKRVPVGDDSEWLKKVLVEVQLLSTLSHANLVSYRHVWLENVQITPFSPTVPCAFILQQYCNSGDLHHYMFGSPKSMTKEELKNRARTRSHGTLDHPAGLRSPRRLQFDEIYSFFRDITSGLHYLHQEGYTHRDLKPSNCLLHKTGHHLRVLVSDFGEMQGADVMRRSTGSTGTISFCAPEVLRHIAPGIFGNFSQKSDIFSLGLIVHLMCFGRLPYASADSVTEENEDVDQLREEISAWTGMDLEHRDRSDLPDRLYKFLKLLLSLDPNERPSTADILQSIKAGSTLHEHAQPKSEFATPPAESNDAFPLADRSSPEALQSSTEARRRSSALIRSNSAETKTAYAAPRHPSGPHLHAVTTEVSSQSDLVLRRASPDVIGIRKALPVSPRLLPPPTKQQTKLQSLGAQPGVVAFGKLALFSIKIWSCLGPCVPLATSSWIAYPLLGMAALDMIGILPGWGASLALLVAHLVIVVVAGRLGRLCVQSLVGWDSI